MIGTKRRSVSLRSDSEEAAAQSKKVLGESPFQSPGVEAPPKAASVPPLDFKRALSSRQHVRALNTQFASWVQSQLLNHPDELWIDGVQDYATHASQILERFSDVVNWLKVNSATGGSLSSVEAQTAEKQAASEAKSHEAKTSSAVPFVGPSKFAPSFSLGLSPNNQNFPQNATTPFASPWMSDLAPKSQSSLSCANTSSGMSSNSQSSSPSTTTFASGLFSKCQSQSPVSDGNASAEVSSNIPQGTSSFASPWTSSVFLNSHKPSSGATASSSSPAWSFGALSSHQSPFKFGNQTSTPSNDEAANDANEEKEEEPSSPSLKKSEEKGIVVVHEVKCKLYVKSSDPSDKDPWKDKGTGQLSIKCKEGIGKGTKESKPTIIIRNDVGRILLNALLYPGIKLSMPKNNSIVAIFHTSGDSGCTEVVAQTFLIRTRNQADRNKLAEAIQEHAPSA